MTKRKRVSIKIKERKRKRDILGILADYCSSSFTGSNSRHIIDPAIMWCKN